MVTFGTTTLLVLGMLLLSVVLIVRDVTRQARTSQLRAELVGGVSHGLKAPLAVIQMYAGTIADSPEASAGARQGYRARIELCATIGTQVRWAVRLDRSKNDACGCAIRLLRE
jgi:signal transduction histidine kinase